MKSIYLCLFCATLLFVSSCASDGSTVNSSHTMKKFSEKIYYDGAVDYQYSVDYFYQNGQLIKTTDGTNTTELTYSGNKIIEAKTENTNIQINHFNYTGDLLTSIVADDEKTEFIYLNNVLQSKRAYVLEASGWELRESIDYIFNVEGNTLQEIKGRDWGSGMDYFKNTFEYDSANSPMKSMNPYLKLLTESEGLLFENYNNKIIQYSYPSVSSTTPTLQNTTVITYDSQNYPILVKKYSGSLSNLISETTIEYN